MLTPELRCLICVENIKLMHEGTYYTCDCYTTCFVPNDVIIDNKFILIYSISYYDIERLPLDILKLFIYKGRDHLLYYDRSHFDEEFKNVWTLA